MTEAQAALEREKCRRNAHHFVFASGLQTKDEHDLVNPLKPFPDEPYLRALLDLFLVGGRFLPPAQARYALEAGFSARLLDLTAQGGMTFIEKSRQMMVSWIICAYALWRAKYHGHQLILFQSKREEDAANMVFTKEPYIARMSLLEFGLPKHLKTLTFPRCGAYCHLFFPNGSHIWGIPEGGTIVRSNTASLIVSDEAAFQPEFGDAFAAAKPAVLGGGQLIAVSSAELGAFADIVEAEIT